jgi:crotonobetainyl-CoA:carnitine CoA-transferase CaiB-like acyl-CoA transferase
VGVRDGRCPALTGVCVLELGTLIAGPFCGRLLADHGADVVKVEAPDRPDPLRDWGQAEVDGHHFFWTVHARNKRCITLDLRHPRGRDLLLDLVATADVVVESFRPATLEKWGLGYDVLSARNPALILARVSGYGQTGPHSGRPGYASVAEAVSGMRHLNGFPGGPPPRMALSIGDSLAGMFAAHVADWAAGHDADTLTRILEDAGVVVGPVNTVAEVVVDPQFRARDMLLPHHDLRVGADILGPGVVPKLDRTPGEVRWAGPPRPGTHNHEVYAGILGLSDEDLAALARDGVI